MPIISYKENVKSDIYGKGTGGCAKCKRGRGNGTNSNVKLVNKNKKTLGIFNPELYSSMNSKMKNNSKTISQFTNNVALQRIR
jgi:hypothetical protein